MMTRTETLRRLRVAAALVRENDFLAGKNDRVEIGLRNVTKHVTELVEGEDGWLHDLAADDLFYCTDLFSARSNEALRTPGAFVHIYFSGTGLAGELNTTRIVWLGTADHEPVYVG